MLLNSVYKFCKNLLVYLKFLVVIRHINLSHNKGLLGIVKCSSYWLQNGILHVKDRLISRVNEIAALHISFELTFKELIDCIREGEVLIFKAKQIALS
jgi:hypothetical protein